MSVVYDYAAANGYIRIDFTASEINVENTIADLQVQELVDAIREAESSVAGLAFSQIGTASGKEFLDTANGVRVGITLSLLGSWLVFSERSSGTFRVLGGNLIRDDGSDPFKPNNLITYINLQSAASTIVSISGGGSGFTSSDRATITDTNSRVQGLETEIGGVKTTVTAIEAVQLTIQRFKDWLFNRQNTLGAAQAAGQKRINSYVAGTGADAVTVQVGYEAGTDNPESEVLQ